MFDLKEYEKYINDKNEDRNSLQVATFNLNKWKYYEDNIMNLSSLEKKGAKRLFKALKQLTPDERTFLAEKYRTRYKGTNLSVPDKGLAKKRNLSITTYRKIRTAIQYKFFYFIKDDLDFID